MVAQSESDTDRIDMRHIEDGISLYLDEDEKKDINKVLAFACQSLIMPFPIPWLMRANCHKKEKRPLEHIQRPCFSERGTRTPDRADMSRLLYRLSYLAINPQP